MTRCIIILAALVSIHCGEENCTTYDFYKRGVCVQTHGHSVDEYSVASTVNYLSGAMEYELPGVLASIPTEANYVHPAHSMLEYDGSQARGVTYSGGLIFVGVPRKGDPLGLCMERYYVLGHELMHVAARHVLGASEQDNEAHTISGFFYGGGEEVDTDSVEHKMALKVLGLCQEQTGGALRVDKDLTPQDFEIFGNTH